MRWAHSPPSMSGLICGYAIPFDQKDGEWNLIMPLRAVTGEEVGRGNTGRRTCVKLPLTAILYIGLRTGCHVADVARRSFPPVAVRWPQRYFYAWRSDADVGALSTIDASHGLRVKRCATWTRGQLGLSLSAGMIAQPIGADENHGNVRRYSRL